MYNDIIDLREFYSTPMGQMGRRLIRSRIRRLWSNLSGMTVLGLGYSTPYLQPFQNEANVVLAIMPSTQGVFHWPEREPGRVALSDDGELLFPDRSIDRLLIVQVRMQRKFTGCAARGMAGFGGGGRIIAVCRTAWFVVRFEQRSPFGHGHPYSAGQLRKLLRDCFFTPTAIEHALYVPPIRSRLLMRSAPAVEKIGSRWAQAVSGVLIVEASKQIYAGTAVPVQRSVRERPLVALSGGARHRKAG